MAEEWRRPPAHVTTPLLTRITEGSLDEDYREVARRRVPGAPRPPAARPHLTATVVIAVFGVLVTTAAVQTSQNSDVTDASRATLISRVKSERAMVADEQRRIGELQDANIAAESDLDDVTGRQQEQLARQRRLEVLTGFVAVHGEGVRVTVTDPATVTDVTQLVRDEDLALLVNGLWSAGAEAIAINGQRLTTLTAIRNSSAAVHVNSRPVNPPYVVSAIGDTATLQANLLDTSTGSRFFDVADQLGFGINMQNEDDMVLPALRGPRLSNVERDTNGKPGMDDEEANP